MSASSKIKLQTSTVGDGEPCLVIAEVAQAHDGSLGLAHSFIERTARSGADAIKFQTHIADAESTLDDSFRVNFSYADKTRYDYWKRMEFTAEQWASLKKHADDEGLIFLSSPFSVQAVEVLENIGVSAWKVGSGEVENRLLLETMMRTKKPLLISSGMSGWEEIERTSTFLNTHDYPHAFFQCTSRYPTPLNRVGLNILHEMKRRLKVPLGLSDHSGTSYPSMAAIARGVHLIEIHVTFDKAMFGPDTSSSVTFAELDELIAFRNALREMDSYPIDKDQAAHDLKSLKNLFGRSLCLIQDFPRGTVIHSDMLTLKKPGTGISLEHRDQCVGKKIVRDVPANRLLRWEDFE